MSTVEGFGRIHPWRFLWFTLAFIFCGEVNASQRTDALQAVDLEAVKGATGGFCVTDTQCVEPSQSLCWLGNCVAPPLAVPKLDHYPKNTWSKVHESATGGRMSAMFFYQPQLGRFVLTGGAWSGHKQQPHFETEHLTTKPFQWINAYPPNAPKQYAPAIGPTQAPEVEKGEFVDQNGVARLPMFAAGYSSTPRAYHQWVYVPSKGRLYAYLWNKLLSFDPLSGQWSEREHDPAPTNNAHSLPAKNAEMVWGNMGYDPIHDELVLIGGTAPVKGGSPGTWLYSFEQEAWRRLPLGSSVLNGVREQSSQVGAAVWDLLASIRNRFHHTESADEAVVVLSKIRDRLVQHSRELNAVLAVAQVPEYEQTMLERSQRLLTSAMAKLSRVVNLHEPIAATVKQLSDIYDQYEQVNRALDVEPPARALSPLAYHYGSAQLVMFGGDGLDRHYGDTWTYDCQHRRWRQHYPEIHPRPRAGHSLLSLKDSDKVILLGGYGLGNGHSYLYKDVYKRMAFEAWLFDPEQLKWSRLQCCKENIGSTSGAISEPLIGASGPNDTIALVTHHREGRQTWFAQLDTEKLALVAPKSGPVQYGSVAFRGDEDQPRPGQRSYDPNFYEREQQPNASAGDDLFAKLQENSWTLIAPKKKVDVAGWGTSTYDAQRRQVLYWGGGHSEYKGTNVFHFSVDTLQWSLSNRPEWVLEATSGFLLAQLISFANRPHIPVHAYQSYAYQPNGWMIAVKDMTFIYDVTRREWRFPPLHTPFSTNVKWNALTSTPHGVYAWASARGHSDPASLFRFDAQQLAWIKQPMAGELIGTPWCDGAGFVYDSYRNALWMAPRKGQHHSKKFRLYRYDIDAGRLEGIAVQVPKVLGDFALWREQVYLPEHDLILLMRRFKDASGKSFNVAYSPAENRYFGFSIPFSDGKDHEFAWSSSLLRDAKTGVVLLHQPVDFWALRFNPDTADRFELK